MLFLKLAARNILRNRRRTLLTLCAVTLGIMALVAGGAMFDGQNAELIRNMTENFTGHAQIQKRAYLDNPSFDLTFAPEEVAVVRQQSEVVAVARRVSGTGLLSTHANTRGVMIIGVDPGAESKVTVLHQRIVQGRYLAQGESGGLVVGNSLAKGLGVKIGDEVAIITEGMHASIGAQNFRVRGIYDSGNGMVDGLQAYIALEDAFALFSTQGGVTALALRLRSLPDSDAIVPVLQQQLAADFSVRGWKKLLPSVEQSVDFHESIMQVVMLILFFIVAVGIAGTLQMAVAERVREFGMQMAIGTSPWQVFRTILYEGFAITAIGFVVGYLIAAAIVTWLAQDGIMFGHHADALQSMQGATGRIYPYLDPGRIGPLALGLFTVALLATFVPAFRAARLSPIAALRGFWSKGGARAPQSSSESILSRWPAAALALRNLFRAPLRSSLILVALSFGLGAYIFVGAFVEGFLSQMEENSTGLITGDVQIQHPDFRFDARPGLSFDAPPPWLDRLRALPEVAGASIRMQGTATVSSARKAEPVTLVGIDLDSEERVTRLRDVIAEGHYLKSDREVLVGKNLASRLNVRVGEKLVVMVQDSSGNLASAAFPVAGIINAGSHGLDTGMAYVTLGSAQRLFNTGERVSSVAIRLHDRKQMRAALIRLAENLPPKAALEAIGWDQLSPQLAQFSNLLRHGLGVVLGIVFVMVSIIVMNLLLMSVFERAKEFGTLSAIGADRPAIMRLVATEAGALGLIGVVAGVVAGGCIAGYYSGAGLVLKGRGSLALGVSDVIHPVLSPALLSVPALLLFVLVLCTSLYPAFRIARLDPVEALRRV